MKLIRRISHLKDLDSLKPDKRWEKTIKYELLDEIASQNRLMHAYRLSGSQKADLFVMRVFNRLAPSMTKVLASFLILMMFFGVNIAAQASVPGETLWPVKRSIEEAELSLTFSPVKKTEVYIKHVNERLDEIDKILEEPSKPEVKNKKEKAIKQAVTHLEKDVISVDSSLKIVKQEKKAIEVVELVKKVTDATKEVENKLEEKKKKVEEDTTDKVLGEVLSNAKAVNKQVKKSAVNVAIEVHEEVQKNAENNIVNVLADDTGKSTTTPDQTLITKSTGPFDTSTPDILEKDEKQNLEAEENLNEKEAQVITNLVKEIVASAINDLSIEVQGVKQKVDIVLEADIENIKNETLKDGQEPSVDAVELDEIDVIKKATTQESEVALEEAKVLLESGMLKDAFDRVSDLQDQYDKAEITLDKIEKAIGDKIEKDANDEEANKILQNSNPSTEGNNDKSTSTSAINVSIKTEDSEIIKSSGIDIPISQNNMTNGEEGEIKEEEWILDN